MESQLQYLNSIPMILFAIYRTYTEETSYDKNRDWRRKGCCCVDNLSGDQFIGESS